MSNNILKARKVPFWEEGLIKWSTLFIGIAIGAYWSDIFRHYVLLLVVVGLVVGIIAAFIWVRE
jgi:hypothetical protein